MIRVTLVDSDINRIEVLQQYFKSSSSINVVNVYNDAQTFINNYRDDCDVVVLNYLLNGLESIDVLSKINENKGTKKVIVFSEYLSADMIKELTSFEPDYIIKGAIKAIDLDKTIICIFENKAEILDSDLNVRITNMLHSLGVPSHIKGFNYIRDSIRLLYDDASLIGAITKELYPSVASINNTSDSKVERAIRHAIEVAWNRGDYDMMEEIFGNSVDFDRAKPTNSEFIVTIADRLKLQDHKI